MVQLISCFNLSLSKIIGTHPELSLFLLQNFYNEIKKDEMYDR